MRYKVRFQSKEARIAATSAELGPGEGLALINEGRNSLVFDSTNTVGVRRAVSKGIGNHLEMRPGLFGVGMDVPQLLSLFATRGVGDFGGILNEVDAARASEGRKLRESLEVFERKTSA